MSLNVLYVGGTGQISLPCVEKSVAAGHNVSVFNRGRTEVPLPKGVTSIVGDMKDPAAYRKLADGKFDVVNQFMVFLPEQMQTDIDVFTGQTAQYIFISSASVYEKPPRHYIITEKTPTVNPYWLYSQNKIACEKLLMGSKGLPWTIMRPSHTVRTGLPTVIGSGEELVGRLLAGKPIIVAGDGATPWTLTRSVDFATPYINLFGKKEALGTDFHITGDKAFIWNDIIKAIARGFGVEAIIVHVPTDTLVKYNGEWAGPLTGDKSNTALFDNSKVKRVAGPFACSENLDEILEIPIALTKARLAGKAPPVNKDDALMDRIAKEQLALGTA
jgi:nucleoside-diphosphate-sugar epimerase